MHMQDAQWARLCGKQFLLWAHADGILLPHNGWARGPGRHGCEDCRDWLHEQAPHEGHGRSLHTLRLHSEAPELQVTICQKRASASLQPQDMQGLSVSGRSGTHSFLTVKKWTVRHTAEYPPGAGAHRAAVYGKDRLDPVAMEDAGGRPINLPLQHTDCRFTD